MVCSWNDDIGAIPVLQRHADPAHHKIAAAAHPVRPLVADPDGLVHCVGVWVPSLNPIRLRGVAAVCRARQKTGLRPANLGHAIGEPGQLPDRMKRHLRIVGAGLDRQIAAGRLRRQLVAVEPRQVDQRLWPRAGEAVTILAVLDEQPRAEAERDGQPGGRQTERLA